MKPQPLLETAKTLFIGLGCFAFLALGFTGQGLTFEAPFLVFIGALLSMNAFLGARLAWLHWRFWALERKIKRGVEG